MVNVYVLRKVHNICKLGTLSEVIIPRIIKDVKGNIPSVPFVNYLEANLKPCNLAEVTQVFCFDDFTFIVDEKQNVWGCGNNTKGQLGLGHMWEVNLPTLITGELKGKVKKIASPGDMNIAVTTTGDMYVWAFSLDHAYKPIRYPFKGKYTVSTVCCGGSFAIILTNQGILYSFGKSNKQGELGIGDFRARSHPEPISIDNEKIVQISCGFKHTLAKGSSGKVYAWGLVYFIIIIEFIWTTRLRSLLRFMRSSKCSVG
jgi:alpha-tubulin suppressor-like RCC1 family protein